MKGVVIGDSYIIKSDSFGIIKNILNYQRRKGLVWGAFIADKGNKLSSSENYKWTRCEGTSFNYNNDQKIRGNK